MIWYGLLCTVVQRADTVFLYHAKPCDVWRPKNIVIGGAGKPLGSQTMIIFVLLSVHPCDWKSNGGCAHVCIKKGSGRTCSCNPGYKISFDSVSCLKG